MKRSTDRILSTHVGSLVRPPALQDFLRAKQAGKPFDARAYDACLSAAATSLRDAAWVGPQDKLACRRTLVVHAAAYFKSPGAFRRAPLPADKAAIGMTKTLS